MPERVIVFLDYQNVYRGARRTYHDHDHDPHWYGQVYPQRLGEYLAADSPFDRELTEVRIYRGLPDSSHDPKGYAACRRQQAEWEKSPQITVINRPLQYPRGWPHHHAVGEKPREKGIDVVLAMDFTRLAGTGYDVGIIFSTDTDLKPALEFVADLAAEELAAGRPPFPRAEVAAWSVRRQHCSRLAIEDHNLYCHWVGEPTYNAMCDLTNYSRSLPGES